MCVLFVSKYSDNRRIQVLSDYFICLSNNMVSEHGFLSLWGCYLSLLTIRDECTTWVLLHFRLLSNRPINRSICISPPIPLKSECSCRPRTRRHAPWRRPRAATRRRVWPPPAAVGLQILKSCSVFSSEFDSGVRLVKFWCWFYLTKSALVRFTEFWFNPSD